MHSPDLSLSGLQVLTPQGEGQKTRWNSGGYPATAFPGPAALETCCSPSLALAQTPSPQCVAPPWRSLTPTVGTDHPQYCSSLPLGRHKGSGPGGQLGTVAKGRGHRKQDPDPIANPSSFFPLPEPPSSPAFLSPVLGLMTVSPPSFLTFYLC